MTLENIDKDNTKENNICEFVNMAYHTYMLNSVWRKLPSFIDWQINVWRRVLWSAYHLVWARQGKPSAKLQDIVWTTLWKLHASWNAWVEWAAKQLWKNFVHKYPMIDWHGTNYGSLAEVEWAAPRYLWASTSKIAEDFMLDSTNEFSVPFIEAFSWKVREPVFLAAKIPYYMIQSSIDIAAWYKWSRVSHNIKDLSKSFIHYIKSKKSPMKSLVTILKWPDFANGGEVINSLEEMIEIYETWKWTFIVRWTCEEEIDEKNGEYKLVITSLPQWSNIETLFKDITELLEKKITKSIIDAQDQSTWTYNDWRSKVRIVLFWKNKKSLKEIEKVLISKTCYQNKVNRVNMLWFDRFLKPKLLGLRGIYKEFLDYRIESKVKEFKEELRVKNEELEIQEWFSLIVNKIDEVIKIIRTSNWREEAKNNLIKKFKLTELQADKIGSRNLFSLTKSDSIEIENKIKNLKEKIRIIEEILNWGNESIEKEIIKEIEALLKEQKFERFTRINNDISGREVKIEEKPVAQNRSIYICLSKTWFINYIDWVNIKETKRNKIEKEINELKLFWDWSKVLDFVSWKLLSTLILISNKWTIYNLPNIEIPSDKKWIPVQSLLKSLSPTEGEEIIRILSKDNYSKDNSLEWIFIWKNWNGLRINNLEKIDIKKTKEKRILKKSEKVTFQIIKRNIDNSDWKEWSLDKEWLVILTSNWKYVFLNIEDIPERPKWGSWTKLIWLNDWDKVIWTSYILKESWNKIEIKWKKYKIDSIIEKWFMKRWGKWILIK